MPAAAPIGPAAGDAWGNPSRKWTVEEVRRLWQLLDRTNSGSIRVADLVRNAAALQRRCPELLQHYERVAGKDQLVRFEDIRRFLLQETSAAGSARTSISSTLSEPCSIPEDELCAIWARLDPQHSGKVGLQQIVEHRDWLVKKLPRLVTSFEEIDSDGDFAVNFEEVKAFFGGIDAWLDRELSGIIGLGDLKDQIRTFHRSVLLDQKRRQDGHDVRGAAKYHMIFQGNPGTGKTSFARIMAKLLMKVGILQSDKLIEVQRSDLVGEHIGHTGPKTQKIIDSAAGGVLFVDEAYRLSSAGQNDFGKEAIEQLMAAMNQPPPQGHIQIYAGYVKDMGVWMQQNEGLYRRIAYTFTFPDYTPLELAEILEVYTRRQGFELEAGLRGPEGRSRLAGIIGASTSPRARGLMNGGLCEHIFAGAKQALDLRDDPSMPSVTLLERDIAVACQHIPEPPQRPVEDHTAMKPQAVPSNTSMASGLSTSRNMVFKLVGAHSLRDVRPTCLFPGMSPYVIVTVDGAEAYRSSKHKYGHTEPVWNSTVILPIGAQAHKVEFTVMSRHPHVGDRFIASSIQALSSVPFHGFDGELDLTHMGRHAGTLQVQMAWQTVLCHGQPHIP